MVQGGWCSWRAGHSSRWAGHRSRLRRIFGIFPVGLVRHSIRTHTSHWLLVWNSALTVLHHRLLGHIIPIPWSLIRKGRLVRCCTSHIVIRPLLLVTRCNDCRICRHGLRLRSNRRRWQKLQLFDICHSEYNVRVDLVRRWNLV